MRILPEPNTEPFGDVITPAFHWNTEPEMKWNYKFKDWEYIGEREDRTKYMADDMLHAIPVGSCRACTNQITPYTKKYYQRHYENGMKYCFLFSAENYYCEECARREAAKDYYTDIIPAEIEHFETRRDGETLEVKVYADGSRIEEVTSREAVKWG